MLHPGSRIVFDLAVTKGRSIARNIRPGGAPDAAIPAPAEKLAIGSALPDFQLTDQQGRTLRTAESARESGGHRFHLYAVPAARRVPAAFGELRDAAAPLSRSGRREPLLLSVTVDPEFDTPAVLADYAHRWAAGPGWRFLTGDVAPLAASLGEVYWTEEGSIGHNSTTSIIGRDGRLAAQVEGSNYRPDQLVHLISRQLENQP